MESIRPVQHEIDLRPAARAPEVDAAVGVAVADPRRLRYHDQRQQPYPQRRRQVETVAQLGGGCDFIALVTGHMIPA